MMLQPGKQTIAIHILPNILRSKGNQTIKSDQLIEYVTENIASVKLLPGRLPPNKSLHHPWVRVMVRVNVGGNLPRGMGAIFQGIIFRVLIE